MVSKEGAKKLASLLFAVTITAIIIFFHPSSYIPPEYGLVSVFLILLFTSATIILPVPGFLVAIEAGRSYPIILVGIAAGAGAALGEFTGYFAGYGASAIVEEKNELYKKIHGLMQKYGGLILFIASLIPNPFFDVAGLIAGSLKYPWWKFLICVFLGKTLRFILLAWLGWRFLGEA